MQAKIFSRKAERKKTDFFGRGIDKSRLRSYTEFKEYLRGGVKVPTGGKAPLRFAGPTSPRAFCRLRFDPAADGNSPDERRRVAEKLLKRARCQVMKHAPCL